MGNAHPTMAPYNVFDCKDGPFILAIGNDGQFRSFCLAAGAEEMANDPRYTRVTDRLANR